MYGLGSAVRNRIEQRGGAARIWAQYQKSELPIPYSMSTEGRGMLYNTTKKHYFDIDRFDSDKLMVYGSDKEMNFYIMLGTMPLILDRLYKHHWQTIHTDEICLWLSIWKQYIGKSV
ncbi:MAG: hypothetical protein ABI813_06745 [Bacteroidota bacterium]